MTDDRIKVDMRQVKDELTRRDLLRRAGLGTAVLVYGGMGAKTAVAGAPQYRGRQLKDTLKIIQWSHFVPAYDKWFDNVYIKRWGQANDTEVTVDHVALTDLGPRAAAEVAAQSGHDIFGFLSPPAAFEDQVIDHKEIVQEVTRKRGKQSRVGFKSTYNPKTKKYFGFSDNYVPDPVHYRSDLWAQIGLKPNTWDDVRRAAPKLKALGNPVGIGMSNEIDSNMALIALMMCFGSYIQNAEHRVIINSKATREALKFMADVFKRGMTSEIFAWTAASNNQAFLAGRLSLALNAISISRSAEVVNPDLAKKTAILPIPKGPAQRMGLEHVMGVYVIWKFAQNQKIAKKFLIDLETKYIGAFENSRFYNFPTWPNAVSNIRRRLERDPVAQPPGKYSILDTISKNYTTNVGHPGFSNAAIDEVFNKFLIPQMFAQVAQGNLTPDDAARAAQQEVGRIFARWRRRGKI